MSASISWIRPSRVNLGGGSKSLVDFYNGRGTAEQWIKEGKHAIRWTRLSCHGFDAKQARLQLHVLAYNLGKFLRPGALLRSVTKWSLTALRGRLLKIGAKVFHHARYVTFQLGQVAAPRRLFPAILERIRRFAARSPRAAPIRPVRTAYQPNTRRGVCDVILPPPLTERPDRTSRTQEMSG